MTNPTPTPAAPDWRELCSELLEAYRKAQEHPGDIFPYTDSLTSRADAALATTREAAQGAEISDRELEAIGDTIMGHVCPVDRQEMIEYGRAIWARAQAARPAIQPVPVSERPWELPPWCDAERRCWVRKLESDYPFGETGDFDVIPPKWKLTDPTSFFGSAGLIFLLPHWAIPLPAADQQEGRAAAGEVQP